MTNKLTLTEQEELFAKDCKLINLKYEYDGYTGTEKWAVVTELTEEELWDKYPDTFPRPRAWKEMRCCFCSRSSSASAWHWNRVRNHWDSSLRVQTHSPG